MVWDFKNANFDRFREKLFNTNWDSIDEYDNIDTITDMFTEKFIGVANPPFLINNAISGVKINRGCTIKSENKYASDVDYTELLNVSTEHKETK